MRTFPNARRDRHIFERVYNVTTLTTFSFTNTYNSGHPDSKYKRNITRFVRCFRKTASVDDSCRFLSIQLLKWTAKTQTDRRLTIKGHNYIRHNKSQELYITTMPIPSKSILLSDVTDCFGKGGMNLCLG